MQRGQRLAPYTESHAVSIGSHVDLEKSICDQTIFIGGLCRARMLEVMKIGGLAFCLAFTDTDARQTSTNT